MIQFLFICFVVCTRENVKKQLLWTPTQIHLSWTSTPTEMLVTWISFWEGSVTRVHYGLFGSNNFTGIANGHVTVWTDSSNAFGLTRYVHRSTMTALLPGAHYAYYVEDVTVGGYSDTFDFYSRDEVKLPLTFAVYGDMGYSNAQALPLLQSVVGERVVDAIIHNGDFGYNLNDYDGTRGDFFFEQIQSVAASAAFMVSPGNHEAAANFTHFKQVFSMPQSTANTDSLYWSMDVGLVHLIAFDTELYYFDSPARQRQMEKWLGNDLNKAVANRNNVPWIIAFGHRPLYCSAKYNSECGDADAKQRKYLEPMFCDAGVDLVIGGHTHNYERMWPVWNLTVVNSSVSNDPYFEPNAPVYVISGAAGCDEDISPFMPQSYPWSAVRYPHYGLGRLQIQNRTHLSWAQYDASAVTWPATPIDTVTIVRKTHARHFAC